MNKNKIIIAVLVIFIVLVAIIALVLKARVKSGAIVPASQKTAVSDQTKTDVSVPASNDPAFSENASPAATSIEVTGPSLAVMPGSPEAPKQEVIETGDKVPAQAIKIEMTAKGFSPKEFRVKSGAEITLALSSTDGNTHVFLFPNASLMGLTTMVLGNETKTLVFNAPKPGSYPFRDDLPNYRTNTGTMIVE